MPGDLVLEIQFANPDALLLLWATPLFVILGALAARWRRRSLLRFQPASRWQSMEVQRSTRPVKVLLTTLAFAALVVAAARPGWDPQEQPIERRGRDVVFVIDVSRSMLAEDLAPNRLQRAKLAILDTIERLRGDRVALVAFAGSASVKSPLTTDYGFFRYAVERLSVQSVPRGGTLIGDALRAVRDQVFDDRATALRDILLISDGEDQGSFPLQVAEELGAAGVRILAVGIGDPTQGQPIPLRDAGESPGGGRGGVPTYFEYEGQPVLTRLAADELRAVAAATPGGRYIHVATGNVDLGDLYTTLIATAEQGLVEETVASLSQERFQVFVAAAAVLLAAAFLLPDRVRRRGSARAGGGANARNSVGAVVAALGLCALLGPATPAVAIGAAEGSERRAHRAYQEGRYDAALGEFEAATEARPAAAELSYGAGLAAYELGDLAHAGGRFAAAAQATSSPEVASASYLALGNTAVRTAQEQQQTDPAAAVSALGGAIESYQRALDLQPGYRDAGHNLEIARLLLEELRNQQERDSQSGAGNDAPGDQGAPDTDAAAEPAGEDGGPEEEPAASQQQQEPGPQPAPPAGEPLDADATAAAIIAQEAANAARRQLLQLEQLQPVEQDW